MELGYAEKRQLGQFDKDLSRYNGFLKRALPADLADPEKAKEYTGFADKLRKYLDKIPSKDHPEVVARRKQLAEFEAAVRTRITEAGGAPPGTAPAGAGAQEDQKTLALFQQQLSRHMANLKNVRPQDLAKPATLAEYQKNGKQLEELLAKVGDRSTPEYAKAKEGLDTYLRMLGEKATEGSTTLGGDDKRRVERIGSEEAEARRLLAACGTTVLGTDGGEGSFHATARRLRDLFAAITNQAHPDVVLLAERLTEFEALLAQKTEVSRQKLAELLGAGDPKGRFEAFDKEFAVPAYPPRLPTKCGDEEIRKWAVAIKGWGTKLGEVVLFLEAVQQWYPRYASDVEFGNRVRRFLADRPRQLAVALEGPLAEWKQHEDRAMDTEPETLSKEILVEGARGEIEGLNSGIAAAKRHAVFAEAYEGGKSDDIAQMTRSLEAKLAALKDLVTKAQAEFLADARVPAGLDEPELLEIAKGLLQYPAERVVVTRELRTTDREYVHTDGWVYRQNYDMFWAHVVHKDDDGKYRIYEYGFCFSRAGPPGTTLNKWIIEEVYKGCEILPENIQK